MDFKESDFDQNNLKIEKELGSGSYGKVYSGYLKSNGLKIAIKRVNKQKIRAVGEYLLEALKKENLYQRELELFVKNDWNQLILA